jgi:RNA polymerase II subunit A-like phosphatase
VHRRFFVAYEARRVEHKDKADSSKKRRNSIKPKPAHDVTVQSIRLISSSYLSNSLFFQLIIPRIRAEVFEGVHILFSSVIPLDTNPEATEIWRMARMFGAKCSTELTADVTHVVAAKVRLSLAASLRSIFTCWTLQRGTVKVDAARKRGGIKIVWLSWFTDCIALWQRQDESAYLLDDAPILPASVDPLPASASADEAADDEWDATPQGEGGTNRELALDAIDWNDINDEVDAAMNESDDDEEDEARSERSAMSEDDWTDDASSVQTNSGPSTPTRQKRKRMRSLTPGSVEGGVNGNGTRDALGSPLAKRKKVAAERTGYSKLKEAITADDLQTGNALAGPSKPQSVDGGGEGEAQVSSPRSRASDEGMQEEEDDDEEDGEDDDDDFLARELEEWG